MLPLVLGTMLNPLNSTMLATSLITLCNSFKITTGAGSILITSLYVTSTVAQPLMGKLADIFSAKRINTLGFILVFIAAMIGILAPSFGWLIVSRVILGLGTSAAYPSAMALINKKYEQDGKQVPGTVLGTMAITGQVSAVLGPVLGGLLTQWLGWRGIFYINVPWVIAGMLLSGVIPNFPVNKGNNGIGLMQRLDVIGIVLFSAFLLALLSVLLGSTILPYNLWITAGLFLAVVWWEWRAPSPFIDVKLLVHSPALLLVYVRTFGTSYILYLMLYAMPQWLEGVKNIQPANTGLLMLPLSVMAISLGLVISKNNKPFFQNALGVVVLLLACVGLFMLTADTPILLFIIFTLVMGCADGVNLIANQNLLNSEAPADKKGVSFGLYRTFQYIGAILSSTQLHHLFLNGVSDGNFHQIGFYALYTCVGLLVLLVPLWLRRKNLSNKPMPEPAG